jgi:drug/metabolite transporter (DMT)-like permease
MPKTFKQEIWERFKMPWKHSAFKAYFFWIVIVFGGLGIGITLCTELSKDSPSLSNIGQSISTTFVALIAASLVDLNLSYDFENIPSLIINSIACIALAILLLFLSFKFSNFWSLFFSIIGYILALLVWILANADNEKLADEIFYKRMMNKASKLTEDYDELSN